MSKFICTIEIVWTGRKTTSNAVCRSSAQWWSFNDAPTTQVKIKDNNTVSGTRVLNRKDSNIKANKKLLWKISTKQLSGIVGYLTKDIRNCSPMKTQ